MPQPNPTTVQIRAARADDADVVAAHMYASSPQFYDFCYRFHRFRAEDYIRYEFRSGRGLCSYRNMQVATLDGVVVAVGCLNGGRDYARLFVGSFLNYFRFFGPYWVWKMLRYASHASSTMKAPKKDEMYFSNFCVSDAHRRKGIGGILLQHLVETACREGYARMVLDVDDIAHEAIALYAKLGFVIERREKFSGRRDDIPVPDSIRMARVL